MVMDLHAYARIMTSREPEMWRQVGHHLTASGIRRARRRPVTPVPVAEGRCRVLVENPDGAVLAVMAKALDGAGYAVDTCVGPEARHPEPCPVLAGGVCALAGRADVIVSGLGLSRGAARTVVQMLHELHPRTTILVDAPAPQIAAHAAVVAGCEALAYPCTRETLLAAVGAHAA